MQQLCYIYIWKCRNLKNIGISINSEYSYSYSEESNTLHISDNSTFIPNFWSNKISSFTAIIGNNGAGKSNIIRFIIEKVIGNNDETSEGLVVWKNNDGKWCYLSDKQENLKIILNKENIETSREELELKTFFYTSHFSIAEDILTISRAGYYNYSDTYLLNNSTTEYLNLDAKFGFSHKDHIACYASQNQMRIALFASKFYKLVKRFGLQIPRYLILVPNVSAFHAHNLKSTQGNKLKIDSFSIRPERNYEEKKRVILRLIFHSILSYYIEYIHETPHQLYLVLIDENLENWNYDTIIDFIVSKYNKLSKPFVKQLKTICREIDSTFYANDKVFYIDLQEQENINKIEAFIKRNYHPKDFITSRFFDLVLSHRLDNITSMSSGEAIMLQLLSRLYDAQTIHPQHIDNIYPAQLIILDEAELGLHPDWQRKYIKTLIDFLNDDAFNEGKVQVIITSHSPLILSDIPKQYTTYLQKENDKTENVSETQTETFAANVFDLYRNTFFLHEGLIGEYAEEKLTELNTLIDSKEKVNQTTQSLVDQIGDKRIRAYYKQQFAMNGIDDKIEKLKHELQRLEEIKTQCIR